MRVAHLVSSLNVGGAERFVLDICRLQREQGLDSCIVSLGSEDDVFVALARSWGLPLHFVKGGVLRRQLGLYRVLKHMDVLHFHSPHPLRALQFTVHRFKKARIIYTRHGSGTFVRTPWPAIHRRVKSAIDVVTFVSKDGQDVFLPAHDWLDVESHVIDNGIDLNTVTLKERHKDSRLSLASVGRMIPLKNQQCLLTAVGLLPKEKQCRIDVHFFGDGPCLEELKQQAEQVHCQTRFHGIVSDRERIYSDVDTLVVTSETEGLSIAIIEAMAFAKSVLASNVGGNPRLVEHNVNGWLFDYNDVQTLASYIERLMESPELISQHGNTGRQRIEKDFSLASSAEQYRVLYFA